MRTYYGNAGTGSVTTEALLNNQEWPEAPAVLAGLNWAPSSSFYSVRNFLVMQRVA